MNNKLLQELMQVQAGINLMWLGNDGWLITDGQILLATDLDLTSHERRNKSPFSPADLASQLDVLLISHEHDDHFSRATAAALTAESRCLFVLPRSCLNKADQIGIPMQRRRLIEPGQTRQIGHFDLTAVKALHGHFHQSVYQEANFFDCGYRFKLGNIELFQPGDSVLLHEHLAMSGVDLLFVSPTEHNTYIRPSVHLIEAINPRWVFLQHSATYECRKDNQFWTRGYTSELMNALPARWRSQLTMPQPGVIYHLEG